MFRVIQGFQLLSLVGIEPHINTERQWVEGKVAAGSGHSSRHIASFWSDRRKGYIMASLQARVNQVVSFVDRCRESLMAVREAMYPLNAPITRLSQLLKLFSSADNLKRCVRHQLVGGATIALAFVRVCQPSFPFKDLHKLPTAAGNKIELSSHYAAVEESANKIVDFSIDETTRLLQIGRASCRERV